MMMRFSRLFILFACMVAGSIASAQSPDIREEQVQFATGTTGAIIRESLTGRETVDYLLGASAGQTMVIDMVTDNSASYFNILEPGETVVAIHNGSIDGNSFVGRLKKTGNYKVRVYLMRSAARRGEMAKFTLNLEVISADYADGLLGGPDFWEVTTSSSDGKLNIRSAPSANSSVVDALYDGTVLRNKGCQISEGRRWCQVETLASPVVSGWAASDFLVESRYINASAVSDSEPVATSDYDATGSIPCARYAGQPMGRCKFGVNREGLGNGSVTISWPDGGSRIIFFEDGTATDFDQSQADGDASMTVSKVSGLFSITIGTERFEIPEAVIFGG